MNMSYCRFYNTVIDLDDCIEALQSTDFNNISESEKRAIVKLLTSQLDSLNEIKENINITYGKNFDDELDEEIINKWVDNWNEEKESED